MIPPRGYIFIGLNIVRVLSIVSLFLMLASSMYTMSQDIKAVNQFTVDQQHGRNTTIIQETNDYIAGSTVPHQAAGVFWAILNRLLIIFQVIILICSEFGWPSQFFETYFPVLGRSFGLGALGIIQCLLGAAVLSHHSDTFALVSSWFVFAIGCINCFLGLVFRGSARERRSIFAWRERARDILPTANIAGHKVDVVDTAERFGGFVASRMERRAGQSPNDSTASLRRDDTGSSNRSKFSGLGFGRQGEKAAAKSGFILTRPVEALPRYTASPGIPARHV